MRSVLLPLLIFMMCLPLKAQDASQVVSQDSSQVASQDLNPKYFPQEQIILLACNDRKDPKCVADYLEKKVSVFLNNQEYLEKLANSKKDTLWTSVKIVFDTETSIDEDLSYVSFGENTKYLGEQAEADLEGVIFDLDQIELIHRKSEPTISNHYFYFSYAIGKSEESTTLNYVPPEEEYTGGVVDEIPIFPGCEEVEEADQKACFQSKMVAHIQKHFKYPEEAKKMGLEGRVYVLFAISKEGNLENVKTRGPSPMLEEEGRRIIELLPTMKHGKRNGKPNSVRFTIPIVFRLR
ncbi:energy transducer TonB [Sungkyunkwania multivorans]|uniref:Energy transducer TonB n=1 Tax=Sungkyunkwania multivorans TaxID=1173618 RepID=A0ABW3D0Z7_9FLAO